MRLLLFTLPLLFILMVLNPRVSAALDHYDVRVEEDLSAVEVNACFAGQPPQRLYRHHDAAEFTEWLTLAGQKVDATDRRVSLRGLGKYNCASWRVNLAAASAAGDYRTALRIQKTILTAGNLWFWRDGDKRQIEVSVHFPAGIQFSTPWPRSENRDGRQRYLPAATSANWTSRLAFGHFTTQQIELDGAAISIAMLGDFDEKQQAEIRQWLAEPAMGVARVTGYFPQQQLQILVLGIGSRSSSVPWARVLRGGGVAIEFFVDETRSLEVLRADWTATHEFSHLLLPYVASQDRWLSEGLASYYQNVLRARDGRLSEIQAWEKLSSGFRRGQTDSRRGGTMDTYWRGASLLLQADSELRARSNGQQSLDSALTQLIACCADPGRRWLALELFEKLDQLTGYGVFSNIYAQHAWDKEFPDPQATLEKLGVERRDENLTLNDAALWSAIRQQIMQPSTKELPGSELPGSE
ncbi:MAG: hypothetical protein SH820_10070 [Xanthomonadales bacterium]|nr:hypothetical protein [Xanthomonadales bacterium]